MSKSPVGGSHLAVGTQNMALLPAGLSGKFIGLLVQTVKPFYDRSALMPVEYDWSVIFESSPLPVVHYGERLRHPHRVRQGPHERFL